MLESLHMDDPPVSLSNENTGVKSRWWEIRHNLFYTHVAPAGMSDIVLESCVFLVQLQNRRLNIICFTLCIHYGLWSNPSHRAPAAKWNLSASERSRGAHLPSGRHACIAKCDLCPKKAPPEQGKNRGGCK